jgi:branched-chain amino acid transport system substrate-binding protein
MPSEGLLGGRKLEPVRRDDEGNHKGVVAARELTKEQAVLFGGLDTPVLAIVPIANQENTVHISGRRHAHHQKWRYNPSLAFRVSAVDEIVNKAMLQYAAQKTFKSARPGISWSTTPGRVQ